MQENGVDIELLSSSDALSWVVEDTKTAAGTAVTWGAGPAGENYYNGFYYYHEDGNIYKIPEGSLSTAFDSGNITDTYTTTYTEMVRTRSMAINKDTGFVAGLISECEASGKIEVTYSSDGINFCVELITNKRVPNNECQQNPCC